MMAARSLSFSGQIDDWVRETEQRMTAVFRESVQRTLSNAQQGVPVDTGYLRASLQVSLQSMPRIEKNTSIKTALTEAGAAFAGGRGQMPNRARGAGFFQPTGDYVLTVARATIGDTVYAGYTASYAIFVEFGTSKMAGRAFVARAAMQWNATVQQVSQELKGRVVGRV